jgi:hypothetical protein
MKVFVLILQGDHKEIPYACQTIFDGVIDRLFNGYSYAKMV